MSTLANATQVLRLIMRLRRAITVSDVSQHLDMPKSSASRTLSQMRSLGFLDRDLSTRAYRPGPLLLEAANHFRTSEGALSLLQAQLDRLVAKTGYTTYIDLRDGPDSLVVHMRIGSGSLQVYTPPGSRLSLHASSVGRAILARLDDDAIIQTLSLPQDARRPKGTNAPTSRELLAQIAKIRARGWSLSRGELIENVAGISTAVTDPSTGQIYGISVAMPAQELDADRIQRFSQLLLDTTRQVGRQIGDPYWLDAAAPQA